jgi:hypothetical protein
MARQIVREDLNKGEITSEENVDIKGLVIYFILVVIVFIGILILFYFFFFANNVSKISDEQYRAWTGGVSSPTEWKTQTQDTNVISAEALNALEKEILEQTDLAELKDFSVDIPLQPVGKTNPFIPWAPAPKNNFVIPDEEAEVLNESTIPSVE